MVALRDFALPQDVLRGKAGGHAEYSCHNQGGSHRLEFRQEHGAQNSSCQGGHPNGNRRRI